MSCPDSCFRIIALEDTTLSACTQDLLWTLHVEALPAVHHEGVLRCGQVAVKGLRPFGTPPTIERNLYTPSRPGRRPGRAGARVARVGPGARGYKDTGVPSPID